ncbi:small ribosomal subunit Rsm22 family protein [Treponema sp.]|uniref:small ribosomal subunit Rsm22 family protein n=1 Tax=Treponema sp. TaxID=166 RepID=UPI002A816A69|nr:small ribosomal subunit Rsm22 family protein [Treponema sp.]MCI6442723.1 small ribosomal subunit Rsm22 family protein [Spirochaetia bacterium]MDY4131815.1 small ribosomal subunit Rsm22 family protein [Treponema sp.]
MANKIELKWYEKKQGIHIKQKISAEQKKIDADEKQRRKLEEKNNSEKQLKQKKEKIERIQKQQKKNFTAERISSLFDPTGIPKDAAAIIEKFDDIVSSTHPLNSKQRALLPQQISALSHNLTDQRGDRRMGYMNETTALSAYVHYFLWWNLVRLVKLFSNMDKSFFDFKYDCIFVDIGSGPLTVPIALLLARPELRKKNVTIYCIDISQQALSFGEDIFLSVAARLETTTWKIIRVKGTLDTSVKDKADLVTCANMLNELHDDADMPPDFLAKKYTDRLVSFVDSKNAKARILSIEPGDPRSARLVSLMRDAFIRKNFIPVAPCCHSETCPMDGKKGGKWCNFAFTVDNAPADLKRISEKANLAKERAVLSFVAVERGEQKEENPSFITMRIASDPIRLPGHRTGYYACSSKGLLLAVTNQKLFSGEKIKVPAPRKPMPKDTKSGALIIDL